MSGVLLAGLTDQEAAAIEIMIGMSWRDRHCVTLTRSLSLAVPEQSAQARACDLCVVDLFGFGMRRHTEAHARRLLDFLADRPAVLLVWGSGGGWLESGLALAAGQHVQWIAMPYSTPTLRDAIRKVLEAPVAPAHVPAPVQPAAEPGQTADAVPAWRRAMEMGERLQASRGAAAPAPAKAAPGAATVAAAKLPVRPAAGIFPSEERRPAMEPLSSAPPEVRIAPGSASLGKGALNAMLTMLPSLRSVPMLALEARVVSCQGPQLLRLGPGAAFVLHFQQGWLASGLPVSALLKLLRTPRLVDSVDVVPLAEDDVEDVVRQHFNGRFHRAQKPLDEITWELVGDAIKDHLLTPQGDLRIQLRRFPNVTALADVGPLDVQLAAICARTPQRVSDLMRAFPGHEQAVLRFVVLATASGLVSVLRDEAPAGPAVAKAPAPQEAAPVAAGSPVSARRGFFKSLLDKLF